MVPGNCKKKHRNRQMHFPFSKNIGLIISRTSLFPGKLMRNVWQNLHYPSLSLVSGTHRVP
jgi:hypothetical protein